MPIYRPLIPTGFVDLDVDYQNVQDNFNQANVVYGTDHYPLDNATSGQQGFHKQVTLNARTDPTTIASQGIVYTKDSADSPGRTDLYYAYQTDAGTKFSGDFFPLNACKAFGKANQSGTILEPDTSFNVASVTFTSNTWTVTLNSEPHTNKDKIMVFTQAFSSSGNASLGVSVVSTKVFTVIRNAADASGISFWVVSI